MRVGVIGACGKMGAMTSRAVVDDPELSLVAAVHPSRAGEDLAVAVGHPRAEGRVSAQLEALVQADAEVAVDFTTPDVVMDDVRFGCTHGIHMVVGTTGVGPDEQATIREWLKDSDANVVVAPNFSIGAVVAQRLAEEAARHFPAAEIIELHHDAKVDAPSGTAAATARRIADARGEAWKGPDAETIEGVRGGSVDGIPVHSVRLPGLVAHQEVLFGGRGQTLSIRHDSTDRSSFMPGVVLAIKEVARRPGLTVGLESLLEL
ncbi:MAG TPA: 4-hydroxy-tetrahydrodipicolinate reductase [Actinomycetota bacterium]